MRKAILRGKYPPGQKDCHGYAHYHGDKHRGHLVHQILHRCLAALGILYHTYYLCQNGVLSGLVRLDTEGPLLIDSSGKHLVPGLLHYRDRLPAEHTLIHVGSAAEDRTVHGHTLAWPYNDRIPRMSPLHWNLLFRTVLGNYGHHLGTQAHESAYGFICLVLCLSLHQTAQKYECYNDTGRLEVQMRLYPSGKPESREKEIERAEHPCHTCAAGHKSVHIDSPVAKLSPGIDMETAPENKDHCCRKDKRHPLPPTQIHEEHTQDKYRDSPDNGTDSLPFKSTVLLKTFLLGRILLVFHIGYQAITAVRNSLAQQLRRTFVCIVAHHGSSGGVIDIGLYDSRLGVQNLTDAGRTGRTSQPCNREYFFLLHILTRIISSAKLCRAQRKKLHIYG